MTAVLNRLADTLVAAVAPKATAQAASTACYSAKCYCRGIYLYYKECCSGHGCGACYSVGPQCA